ncbi:YciI family protein [Tropicibacter sp. Alg240-R139]|uniref:YciI family protein n=1 Tax=Tropicibacter sp. Alg240-R139 TaxID=2305991 RepID=UPI0013DF4C4A|nr:YciI family protein [Tropicibacter sp. Alg240-R139]
MLFIRLCIDRPYMRELREENRTEHRAYLQSSTVAKLIQAGPLLNDNGSGDNIASFMVIEADSLEAAQKYHDDDPFTRAGIYEKSYIHEWEKHFG